MNLVISLATRGRPDQVCDTIRKSVANWTDPNTVMQVQLDHDDPVPYDYLMDQKIHERVLINVQQREDTIAEKWNRALVIPADVYMSAADDDPYVVPGYDTKILEAAKRFPDGIGVVYGGMANLSFTGVSAPTKKMCDKMGGIFIASPPFPYWFIDHWQDDVVKMIGRLTYADVRTDQTKAGHTQELREPWWWATFFDACYLMRRRQARRIIEGTDFMGPVWLKDLIYSCHPLIEQRSRGVNESVRQDPRLRMNANMDTKDARYQRVKQKAIAMLSEILSDPEMPEQERIAFAYHLTPPTTIQGLKQAFA